MKFSSPKFLFLGIFLSVVFLLAPKGWPQSKRRKPVPALPPAQTAPLSETRLTRVDPHGAQNKKPTIAQVQEFKECAVCHSFQVGQMTTHSDALQSCTNCHNSSPHSGIVEHQKHQITCISCHTFHRGDAVKNPGASGRFKGLQVKPVPTGLVEKSTDSAMLKKTCLDCHKW